MTMRCKVSASTATTSSYTACRGCFRPAYARYCSTSTMITSFCSPDALRALEPDAVAESVTAMATGDAGGLAVLIPRFIEERFLWDYLDDAKLWVRLNQVMRRVKLPLLPEPFCQVLPEARRMVAERSTELLTPTPPDETAS